MNRDTDYNRVTTGVSRGKPAIMEHVLQSYPEDARRIGEEYLSSLTDLNCNSKPLINMLTMLAEENINYAHVIVRVVEYHISQVNK